MKEFSGRMEYSCAEGDYVWSYDKISSGVYKLNLKTSEVKLVLNPTQIHRNKINEIIGIIKKDGDIILVPRVISDEWIVFREELGTVLYIHPVVESYRVGEVKVLNGIVYLLPTNTKDPILLISLKSMRCLKKLDNWYSQDDKRNCCWGSMDDGVNVFFPIVYTNHVCRINSEELKSFRINISEPILSIAVDSSYIWILPVNGRNIYRVDKAGNMVECIDLMENIKCRTDQFVRIVAIKDYVLLFPNKESDIYIYIKSPKKFTKINTDAALLYGRLLSSMVTCSYWDYCINDNKLYLLPLKYKYTVVDLVTLEVCEKRLIWNDLYSTNDYWSFCLLSGRRDVVFRELDPEFINDFIQFICKLPFSEGQNHIIEAGKGIWESCKQC